MWPFKKQEIKDIANLKSDDHVWSVLEVSGGEGPMLVRVNNTAKEWAKHPKLNIRVGFAIPLKTQNPDGMPNPEENSAFNQIEDELCDLIAKTGPSIQVLAVTTGTFKEFVFYIENASGIEGAHKEAIAKFPEYEVQCYGENDPKWQGYFQWQKA
ncbi:DUF695 domain-containing protein [Rheinheimera baltica]|uniref:DUF695 domain-containing protein n=1 Tax=Rheinheimera baltica TaxID=67576 RepID=UPI00273FB0DB|nr:DUF695 domain-containing protein [Rheinheimera baltica]MDP5188923.1 DUF695 domain-containing protein [Rheinheimera baltica]